MRILAAMSILVALFAFPQRVSTDLEILRIHYFEICDAGEVTPAEYKITIPSWLTVEHRAQVVFSQIFNNIRLDKMAFVPRGVKVLDVFFCHDHAHLIVNVSSAIFDYGGTMFERYLVETLLLNAAAMPQ